MNLREYQKMVDDKTQEANRALRSLEDIDSRMEKINSSTNVCLLVPNKGLNVETVKVSDILSDKTMVSLFDQVMRALMEAREERVKKLDDILGISNKNLEFKATVDEMVEQAKSESKEETKAPRGRKVTVTDKIDVKVVQDMLNKGHSQAVIAKKFAVSAGTMCQFININKLVKSDNAKKSPREGSGVNPTEVQKLLDKGMNSTEIAKELGVSASRIRNVKRDNGLKSAPDIKDLRSLVSVSNDDKETIYAFLTKKIPEIKALYTNGPFDLKKLAVEYACDKKILHEFLSKNGLLKPSKNDPFKGR